MDRVRYILANMNDYRPTVTHAKNVQMKDAQLAIAIDITNLSMQSLVKLLKSRLRETLLIELIDSKDLHPILYLLKAEREHVITYQNCGIAAWKRRLSTGPKPHRRDPTRCAGTQLLSLEHLYPSSTLKKSPKKPGPLHE